MLSNTPCFHAGRLHFDDSTAGVCLVLLSLRQRFAIFPQVSEAFPEFLARNVNGIPLPLTMYEKCNYNAGVPVKNTREYDNTCEQLFA